MNIDPATLLFTQDSIKNTFQVPHEDERIDDAVDAILQGKLTACAFPAIRVVSYEGHLWSLDNRRLWVFKKAKVETISVFLSSKYYFHRRFQELITDPALMNRIRQPCYWPRVRGPCRKKFHSPVPTRRYASHDHSARSEDEPKTFMQKVAGLLAAIWKYVMS
ncbi:hypothetical protein R1flu_002643 [Riccia fluitans]|uniref:Fungal-type protein kinase domain-containing protein n=1 Tax=Riccia fluitans TaxID=41844 RepID=A0ABD1Y6P6_9MARC